MYSLKQRSKEYLNRILSKTGYQVVSTKRAQFDPVIDKDKVFLRIYNEIADYTMTTRTQCFALYSAVRYTIQAGIPGDFVECGVWRGGNAMLIAKVLQTFNVADRRIYLYDTFAGMTEPSATDMSLAANHAAKIEWVQKQGDDHNDWCYAGLAEVQQNMGATQYPTDMCVFVEGMVEDTIPETVPETIALLRLDTDWYSSTKHELEHLYPRISTGGVLIIDDYGTWAGSKQATDEYFATKPVLLNQIDKQNRLVIKT